jgi:hypothetical protein
MGPGAGGGTRSAADLSDPVIAVWPLFDQMECEHMHPNKRHLLQGLSTFGLVFAVAADQALAALPAPVAPSTAPAASDWLGLIKGYIKDGGIINPRNGS